jgi:hypothetical protein
MAVSETETLETALRTAIRLAQRAAVAVQRGDFHQAEREAGAAAGTMALVLRALEQKTLGASSTPGPGLRAGVLPRRGPESRQARKGATAPVVLLEDRSPD